MNENKKQAKTRKKIVLESLGALLGEKAVLVVDNHLTMRKMIRTFLMQSDLDSSAILLADDGDTALRIAEEEKENLGFVLLDWNLPRVHGMKVLQKLRSVTETRNVPILMVSAETHQNVVLQAVEGGVNGYLAKPFSSKDLEEKMRNVLKPPEYVRRMSAAEKLIEQKRYDDARQILKIVMEEKPNSPGARMLLGAVYERTGDKKKAEELYEEAVEMNPQFLKALNNLASFHIKNGNEDEALKALVQADQISPDMAERKVSIGHINLGKGNIEEAQKAFNQAVIMDPDKYEEIATIYFERNEAGMAAELLSNSVSARKRSGALSEGEIDEYIAQYNEAGIQFRKNDEWEKAIDVYKAAMQVDSRSAVLHFNMAKAYMQGNKREEAKKHLSLAEKMNRESSDPDPEISELVKKDFKKLG